MQLGRKAAAGLLNAPGAWTREAAQFALAAGEDDVLSWIDLDRAIAQGQDDRETALYIAQIADPDVAEAARKALESNDSRAIGDFITSGVIGAKESDNRINIFRILNTKPGTAVKTAANNALNANTAKALQDFFDRDLAEAVREDDAVATGRIIATAAPYTKAHAQVAMEGPTWMRRRFIEVVQYETAQLDYDSASHVAAIRAAIAGAAKIAQEAQRDAARASQAAAQARQAAAEAAEWAGKAQASADKAAGYALEAREHADTADRSAADARASADTAKAAVRTAHSAVRNANYAANRAIDASQQAVASSNSARAAATNARQSAIAAGQNAAQAAAAATEARQIAVTKRQAEVAEAAQKAEAEAKENREKQRVPADTPGNDQVNPPPGTGIGPGGQEPGQGTAGRWADTFYAISDSAAKVSIALRAASLIPVFRPLASVSHVLNTVSIATGGLSTILTGFEHGFTSDEFVSSASRLAMHLTVRGLTTVVPKVSPGKAVDKVVKVGGGIASSVTKKLASLG
ncbi:ALF repeat-containing protein [Streptomyces sp. HSW2009]|uniref:ALF repeat-containing protein n=1 Tax=Streptomyces sp. HSW2009 TaxID=3142890 RepID=UPI0032EDEE8A